MFTHVGLLGDFFVDLNVKFPDRQELYLTDSDELSRSSELPFTMKYFLLESEAWNVSSHQIQRDARSSNYLRLPLFVSSAIIRFLFLKHLDANYNLSLRTISSAFFLPRQSVRVSGTMALEAYLHTCI